MGFSMHGYWSGLPLPSSFLLLRTAEQFTDQLGGLRFEKEHLVCIHILCESPTFNILIVSLCLFFCQSFTLYFWTVSPLASPCFWSGVTVAFILPPESWGHLDELSPFSYPKMHSPWIQLFLPTVNPYSDSVVGASCLSHFAPTLSTPSAAYFSP